MSTHHHLTTQQRGLGPVALGFTIGGAAAVVGIVLGVAIAAALAATRAASPDETVDTAIAQESAVATPPSRGPSRAPSRTPTVSASGVAGSETPVEFATFTVPTGWLTAEPEYHEDFTVYRFSTPEGIAEATVGPYSGTSVDLLQGTADSLATALPGWEPGELYVIDSPHGYDVIALPWTWQGTTQCSIAVTSGASGASVGSSGSGGPCTSIEEFALSIEFTDE